MASDYSLNIENDHTCPTSKLLTRMNKPRDGSSNRLTDVNKGRTISTEYKRSVPIINEKGLEDKICEPSGPISIVL